MQKVLENIKQAVIDMNKDQIEELVQKALDEGIKPKDILDKALTPAMDFVGGEYEKGNRYVPEMLLSAESMKEGMNVLKPLLAEAEVEMKGKVVMGTVEGDLHDIGQNLVSMLLEGAGFEVTNLGTEVSAEKFTQVAQEKDANLIGLSALLTTTMTHMPEIVEALKEAGLDEKVKVMIGGAPVSKEYADEIGADGYAPDAASAVKLAERLAS